MPHHNAPTSAFAPLAVIVRYGIYSLAFFLFFLCIPYWSTNQAALFFKENGTFEWLQFSMLCLSSSILLTVARLRSASGLLCLMMASVTALAACRELDKVLDSLIPILGWKVAFAFPLMALLVAWPWRRNVLAILVRFANTHAFATLWAAVIIAVPLAQLVGDGTFLQTLLQDDYNRIYKRVFEEACEGAGYLMLIFGSIESALVLRQLDYQPKSPDSATSSLS